MTTEIFAKAINEIDYDLINKAAIPHRERKSTKILKYCSAAVLTFIIAAAVILSRNAALFNKPAADNGSAGGEYQNAEHEKFSVVGTGYTDEQIRRYVEQNKDLIAGTVSSEYGCADEIKIYTKGYCHASLGKKNIVNRDCLTLPIVQNGKIAATMEVYKVDGVLNHTINIGGETFKNLDRAFSENPNSDLVFAFAGGACEVVITPGNKIYETVRGGNNFLDRDADLYSLLKSEYNTFSSADLDNSENFIVVSVTDSVEIPGGNISKITVIADFREQMGAEPKVVSNAVLPKFESNISKLSLSKTEISEVPAGGGYKVAVYYENGQVLKLSFLSETLVRMNGSYYTDKSGAAKEIVYDVTAMLK